VSKYHYDFTNRLVDVITEEMLVSHSYNGLGDRHQQTVDSVTTNYTLNLNTGLTQVLADSMNAYLYGNGRISQTGSIAEYFLADALRSVRQLTDPAGAVTLTQSYAPYGDTISSAGSGVSAYQFTGEMRDANGLTYLRSRYLDSGTGRFISRDIWAGDYNRPLSLNRWGYVEGNPVNFVDPSGRCSGDETDVNNSDIECWNKISEIERFTTNIEIDPDNWTTEELVSVKKALEGIVFTIGGPDNFTTIFTNFTLHRAGWFHSWITGAKQGQTAVGLRSITFFDDAFDDSYDIGAAVVIHEFGHVLDARFDFISHNSFKDTFWNDCELNGNSRCKTFKHDPTCNGLPASIYAYGSPSEDFAEMFAWYVWEDN